MIPDLPDIDRRPSLLLGWTPENIALVTREWPRSDATPEAVADMLAEARRLFVGSSMCYDNLTAASLKALQAAEHGLRLRLGIAADARMTFGQLLKSRGIDGVLNPRQRDWYQEFALHFRNKLAHPHGAVAFSPGIAEPILRTAHEMVSQLFPPPASAVC
jgi:hypothetical protein